jgi:predicted regulator of amino acid metabolism with ACT domain
MWRKVVDHFHESPQRLRVAQAFVRHGFRISKEKVTDAATGRASEEVFIKCGNVRISLTSVAEALEIDRRTVKATAEDIAANYDLYSFFSRILPAGPSLEKVAQVLGYGVITIFVESPENPGILSEVTATIAGYGIPIRQVLAEDVAIYEQPCLKVITVASLPGAVIETLTAIKGVSRVIIDK